MPLSGPYQLLKRESLNSRSLLLYVEVPEFGRRDGLIPVVFILGKDVGVRVLPSTQEHLIWKITRGKRLTTST